MERIEFEDLSQKVYRTLKEMILKNEIQSGDRLLQEELAERFGVSRTPLLSAISKLEKEMLVEIVPRKGAFIRKYSLEELLHIYAIRVRLEPLGAREAAENGTPDEIEALGDLVREFRQAVDSGEEGISRETDYRIHMSIMEMSRNRILYDIISSFNIVVISNLKGFPRDPHESMREHDRIFEAIRSGYGAEAESVMTQHISRSMTTLQTMVNGHA